MKFLTYEEMGKEVAERALDDFLVNDKTLREWINLMFEGVIPMSVIDDIKSEILSYKDDKIIHAETNEMIDIVLEIIDRHLGSEVSICNEPQESEDKG